MRILAVDSSSMTGSAAILEDDRIIAECALSLQRTHSERLMPAIDWLFSQSGLSVDQIDLFAVSTGPGSFTGLRIGLGTIKGLAFALHKPAIGVSTLMGLAAGVLAWNGTVITLIDARHQHVFAAGFRVAGSGHGGGHGSGIAGGIGEGADDGMGVTGSAGMPEYMASEAYCSVLELRDKIGHLKPPFLFVGDGAIANQELLRTGFPESAFGGRAAAAVRAGDIGRVALWRWNNDPMADPEMLTPNYLRLSEAEIKLEKKDEACGTD
jgi:tRNA threonylcarbamoyladenosine biosynthesis protein TsaB